MLGQFLTHVFQEPACVFLQVQPGLEYLGRQVHDLDGSPRWARTAYEDCCGRFLRDLLVRRDYGDGFQLGDQGEQVAGEDNTSLLHFVVERCPHRVDPHRPLIRVDGAGRLGLKQRIMKYGGVRHQ